MGSSQAAGLEPQGGKPEGKAALLPDGSRFIGWLSTNLLSKFHVFGYCVGEFFFIVGRFFFSAIYCGWLFVFWWHDLVRTLAKQKRRWYHGDQLYGYTPSACRFNKLSRYILVGGERDLYPPKKRIHKLINH